MTTVDVSLTVNGAPRHQEKVPARMTLADFLRDRLGLTGTHLGCEQGVCGACTVLVDGTSMRSCLMLAAQADGRRVETVESLATDATGARLQRAFADCDALQCGFCTPGFLMAATEAVRERQVTEDAVRESLSGNLCRCTGYQGIVDAVVGVARQEASTCEAAAHELPVTAVTERPRRGRWQLDPRTASALAAAAALVAVVLAFRRRRRR